MFEAPQKLAWDVAPTHLAAKARACRAAIAQLSTRACNESARLVSRTGTRVPSTSPAAPARPAR